MLAKSRVQDCPGPHLTTICTPLRHLVALEIFPDPMSWKITQLWGPYCFFGFPPKYPWKWLSDLGFQSSFGVHLLTPCCYFILGFMTLITLWTAPDSGNVRMLYFILIFIFQIRFCHHISWASAGPVLANQSGASFIQRSRANRKDAQKEIYWKEWEVSYLSSRLAC